MHDAVALMALLFAIPDPFADLSRFPPHDYACLQHNQAMMDVKYLAHFATCGEAFGGPEYWLSPAQFNTPSRYSFIEASRNARHRLTAWRLLRHATGKGELDERLEALRMLRDVLGDCDWAAGQMP